MPVIKIDDAKKQRLIRAFDKGIPVKLLAATYGVSIPRVYQLVAENKRTAEVDARIDVSELTDPPAKLDNCVCLRCRDRFQRYEGEKDKLFCSAFCWEEYKTCDFPHNPAGGHMVNADTIEFRDSVLVREKQKAFFPFKCWQCDKPPAIADIFCSDACADAWNAALKERLKRGIPLPAVEGYDLVDET